VDGGDGWRDEEEEEAAERVGGGEDQKRPPEGHGVVWGLRVREEADSEGRGNFGDLWNSNRKKTVGSIEFLNTFFLTCTMYIYHY
jgi:hypothetical protein